MSVLDRAFQRQIRHITPDPDDPRSSAVRQQIMRDFGAFVPPFALHLPSPPALRAYWTIASESTSADRVDRAAKEVVAAAVSAINTCPYCVDVHATMLRATGDATPAAAITSGDTDRIADADRRALVAWARATRQPGAPLLHRPPFPPEHAPELIGIAVSFHYINRMVNIFVGPTPFPLPAPRAKPIMARLAVPLFRRMLATTPRPGASLALLAPAALPDDLHWAQGDPIIAQAFARAAATFDDLGRRVVPQPVRDLVTATVHAWRGQDPGLSRRWSHDVTQPLPAALRPLARLALLTAVASYQVDDQVIAEARTGPEPASDEVLISITAWAAFTTARRIGTWLRSTSFPAVQQP